MDARESQSGTAPKRVALFAGHLETEYTRTLIFGAADRLRDDGYTTLVFPGGILGEGARKLGSQFAFREELYALAGPHSCQGVLCLSGTVSQLVDGATFSAFLARYAPLPIVSVAVPTPAGPSISMDDEVGMYDAVTHLIEQHGRRGIAMIRGPESSGEAERRFLAYKRSLEQHGLTFDPERVAMGNWMRDSGAAAMTELLERRCEFDAVVGANDPMASGAAVVLWSRGVAVPRDVSLVGFDDSDAARFAVPPLTTVRQPLHRLGFLAADTLLRCVQGSERLGNVVLSPKLVVRDSCGCFLDGVPVARGRGQAFIAPRTSSASNDFESVCQILGEVFEAAGVTPRSLPAKLIEAFESDYEGRSPGQVLTVLRNVLAQVPPFEATPWELRPVVAILRQFALPRLAMDPALRTRAESVLQDAAVLVGASARRAEARRRLMAESRARTLSHVGRGIDGTAELAELKERLGFAMKHLHVRSSNVVLFDDPSRPWDGARLSVRTGPPLETPLPTDGVRFDPRRLVPEGIPLEHGPGLVVVLGLADARETLGYLTLEIERDELSLCGELADHVASALARVRREKELSRLHAAERERSVELERAAVELRANQEKLVISEKMATLGALAAGMAQEMATPLEAMSGSLSQLHEYVDAYDRQGSGAGESISSSMDACIARAIESAERVAGFVQGIKTQTRDLSRREFTRFDAVSVVKDSLLLLHHASTSAGCAVSFRTGQTVAIVFGSPGRLAQVVTNLVNNAIDASLPKGGGPIEIRIEASDDNVFLTVTDHGIGIAQADLSRVFDPLYTTKRFGEGTGLGLAIAHNIVVGDFGGSVEIDSDVGEGTRLKVRLPLHRSA